MTRRVDSTQATVNVAAKSTIASHSRSKICASLYP
jgi:hypothetical protein